MPDRNGVIIISVPVVILGGMVLTGYLVASLGNYLCDGCMGRPFHSGLEEFVSVVLVFLLGFIGILIGVVLWLCLMRQFFTRDEIAPHFLLPGIPVISNLIQMLFDLFFPAPKS